MQAGTFWWQPATIPDSIGDLSELTTLHINFMRNLVGGSLLILTL